MLLPWSKVFKFQVSSSKIKMPNIFTHFDSLQKSKSAISPKNNWIALSLKKTSETHEKPMRKFPTLHFYYALSKYDAFLTSCLLAVKPVYWFAVYCIAQPRMRIGSIRPWLNDLLLYTLLIKMSVVQLQEKLIHLDWGLESLKTHRQSIV